MELANSRVEKNVNISQEKLGFRVVQVEKHHVSSKIHITPNKKTKNHREPPHKLCLKIQHVSASELRVLVTHWAGNAWTKLCEGGGEGREGKLPVNMEESEEDVLLAQLKRKVARV